MQLEYLQIWLARVAAAHLLQTRCCYTTDVIMDITWTASRRHWNKYQMVSSADAVSEVLMKYTENVFSHSQLERLPRIGAST